jgi:hypothetical protein
VKPLRTGWTLECEEISEHQVFEAGGEAERSTVRLAAAITKASLGPGSSCMN